MYSYTFDEQTGGILLNSSPTIFSKEPRPVYASEMDLLEFDKYWEYDKQNDIPYLWTESNIYYYKGKIIAKIKGGDLYTPPEVMPQYDEMGNVVMGKEFCSLEPMDIVAMCEKNKDFLAILENTSVKLIVKAYEKYKNKLDIFHVAFSGGKDSAVLLDLVKKALPKGSFVVIFGDTGMEFPDTYEVVRETKRQCEEEGIPFYEARSHLTPDESWKLFGPPARVLRWCCSVHKSTPQTLKMRDITGKNDYTGLDYVGVRAHESLARSKYKVENYGKKQKGQYSYNPILEWTSAEIWLYIFANDIKINGAYKKGNSRAGCLFCPMSGGCSDYFRRQSYKKEVDKYISYVTDSYASSDEKKCLSYLMNGGWSARNNGRNLKTNTFRCIENEAKNELLITNISPISDWKEWMKTIGELYELDESHYQIRYDDSTIGFEVKKSSNGFIVRIPSSVSKNYPRFIKLFRQVFRKATYCVGCKVCEINCKNGSIKFVGGKIKIDNCIHCHQCHEIDDGCLLFHSLRHPQGGGKNMKSLNSFADHAPKRDWLVSFFDLKEDFFIEHTLGPMMYDMFRRFLKDAGLNEKNHFTAFAELIANIGWETDMALGLMLCNLAYENPQIEWYIKNMDIGHYYDRNTLRDMLEAEGVKQKDALSICKAFKRIVETPFGDILGFGAVLEDDFVRLKCFISDNRVILYALYKFVEKCNMEREFHISVLFDEEVERDGVSPVRIFGLYDEGELQSILLGLTARYPEFINATFTNDLKTITLYDKTPEDVLELFKEEF